MSKTKVQSTSLEAYHNPQNAVARASQADRVMALIVAAATTPDGDITGGEIAQRLKMQPSTVSGRIGDMRKAIERDGHYLFEGTKYLISHTRNRLPRYPTATRQKAYVAIKLSEQLSLF